MSSRLAAATAVSLAILALLTILVGVGLTDAFDLATTRTLQSIASFPLDLLANANTLFGQATTTTVVAGLLAIVAWRREGAAWLALGAFGSWSSPAWC